MKLYQILIFILFALSCSKDNVDTSPKKVIKCSDWAFDYNGEKLNQIYYTKGSDYKIKFIYKYLKMPVKKNDRHFFYVQIMTVL